jgi:hypothetical protein
VPCCPRNATVFPIPIEIDPAVVAATEDPLPEPYGQDLANAPAVRAALLAGEVRDEIAARGGELRRATGVWTRQRVH